MFVRSNHSKVLQYSMLYAVNTYKFIDFTAKASYCKKDGFVLVMYPLSYKHTIVIEFV